MNSIYKSLLEKIVRKNEIKDKVIKRIKELHTHQIPEIIALDITPDLPEIIRYFRL